MQFLHEEGFRKIFNFVNNIPIFPIRLIAKFIFYIVIFSIMGLIVYLIVSKNYLWLVILLGFILIGELAHRIRKSREKELNELVVEETNLKNQIKNADIINDNGKKSLNNGLLKKK